MTRQFLAWLAHTTLDAPHKTLLFYEDQFHDLPLFFHYSAPSLKVFIRKPRVEKYKSISRNKQTRISSELKPLREKESKV